MFNIKALKNSAAQSKFRYLKPEDHNWLNKLATKLNDLPILRRLEILDDLADYRLSTALVFFIERWIKILTLSELRHKLSTGWDYFKVGFNSWDFDSQVAMTEFQWKLERIAKHLEEHDIHVDAKQCAADIREFNRLINRVMEDDYVDEFMKPVDEKYGDNIHYSASTKGFMGSLNEGKGPFKNPHTGMVTFNKREKWTPETHKEIIKAERVAYKKAWKQRSKEWKKALTLLEKEFFKWWC